MYFFLKTGFIVSIVLWLFANPSFCQYNANSSNDFLNSIKEKYTVNDILINGKKFTPANSLIKGHPYLSNNNWINTDLYIKGEKYSNEKVRYNIVTDELIILFVNREGTSSAVVINNNMVDSLHIQNHSFISLNQIQEISLDRNFIESIRAGSLTFYIAYYKEFIRMYTDACPYGKYSGEIKHYYLTKDGKQHKVNRKHLFVKSFPEHKNEIRRFIRKNKIKYNKATTSDIKKLIQFCNELEH